MIDDAELTVDEKHEEILLEKWIADGRKVMTSGSTLSGHRQHGAWRSCCRQSPSEQLSESVGEVAHPEQGGRAMLVDASLTFGVHQQFLALQFADGQGMRDHGVLLGVC